MPGCAGCCQETERDATFADSRCRLVLGILAAERGVFALEGPRMNCGKFAVRSSDRKFFSRRDSVLYVAESAVDGGRDARSCHRCRTSSRGRDKPDLVNSTHTSSHSCVCTWSTPSHATSSSTISPPPPGIEFRPALSIA